MKILKNENIKNVVLIDFSNIVYMSAFSKFVQDSNQKGGALAHILLLKYQKIIKHTLSHYNLNLEETLFMLCSDRKSVYRSNLSKNNYKANRSAFKEENKDFYDLIFSVSNLFLKYVPNINLYSEGNEADDIINKMTYVASKKLNKNVYIYSGDNDLLQLLKYNNVKIIDPKKYEELNLNYLKKKFKINDPKKLLIYKAIYGDPSDNINSVFKELNMRNSKSKKVIEIINNTEFDIRKIIEKISELYKFNDVQKTFFRAYFINNIKLISLRYPKISGKIVLPDDNLYKKFMEKMKIKNIPEIILQSMDSIIQYK